SNLRPSNLQPATRNLGTAESGAAGDLVVGDVVINPSQRIVRRGSEPVELKPKEFDLLVFLASYPGHVFTRETLLDRVWGYDFVGGTRTVDVHVRWLRLKL